MMYFKLTLRSVRRSIKDYLIYIVILTICVVLFYAFLSISSSFYEPDIPFLFSFMLFLDNRKIHEKQNRNSCYNHCVSVRKHIFSAKHY